MASFIYNKFKEFSLKGGTSYPVDFDTDTIKVALVTSAAAHGIPLRPHAATITISDGLAVVHREVTVLAETGPAPQPRRISYVTVYERRDGKWFVALNSARSA